MQLLSNLTYEQITTSLYNKNIHFTSDCEFFPEFDVIGKIIKTRIQNTEIVMTFKTKQHIYKQCVKDAPLDLFIEEVELKYAPNFRIKLNTYLETQGVFTRYNMKYD